MKIYTLFTIACDTGSMGYLQHFSVSRISSGITVVACAGFLMNAMLSDHGGSTSAQRDLRERMAEKQSLVANLSQKHVEEWRAQQTSPDQRETASIADDSRREPSVLSLIRENDDFAPSVSSGTRRVSVIVKGGDTLYGIARRHGMDLATLARLNGIDEPYTIRLGQTIYIAR